MSAKDYLNSVFLVWFSKPKCDRALYRVVQRQRISSIVEVGLTDLSRSRRLIELAARGRDVKEIRYTGVDQFEARTAGMPEMTLKQTHQSLAQTGAAVRLIPGEPQSALARYANHLGGTDLLIVSGAGMGVQAGAWFYVPRMLAPEAHVFLSPDMDSANPVGFRRVLPEELSAWAEIRAAA